MTTKVTAFAAPEARAPFEPYAYELPEIGPEDVDIKVEYCGICHSDLSMWQNAWGRSHFPLVAGHEIVGTVVNVVGTVPEPLQVRPGSLIFGEKSLSGSALGTPVLTREMLDFAARHNIEAMTEEFEFKDINAAFAHLESGKARYRVVLKM